MCKYLNKNHKNYNSLLQSPQQNPFYHFETKFFCDKSYEKKRNEKKRNKIFHLKFSFFFFLTSTHPSFQDISTWSVCTRLFIFRLFVFRCWRSKEMESISFALNHFVVFFSSLFENVPIFAIYIHELPWKKLNEKERKKGNTIKSSKNMRNVILDQKIKDIISFLHKKDEIILSGSLISIFF